MPRIPRQNQQLGRPLLLLKEEAALLIKRDIGQIFNDISEVTPPNEKDIQDFIESREKLYNEQVNKIIFKGSFWLIFFFLKEYFS